MREFPVSLIEDNHNEKFGYYLNTKVKNENYIKTDIKTFEFNLESNGRLIKPMKFPIKYMYTYRHLYTKSDEKLMDLGDIVLYKENKGNSNILRMEINFITETYQMLFVEEIISFLSTSKLFK